MGSTSRSLQRGRRPGSVGATGAGFSLGNSLLGGVGRAVGWWDTVQRCLCRLGEPHGC